MVKLCNSPRALIIYGYKYINFDIINFIFQTCVYLIQCKSFWYIIISIYLETNVYEMNGCIILQCVVLW